VTVAAFAALALFVGIFLLPLYFQLLHGFDAETSGLLVMPYLVSTTFGAYIAGSRVLIDFLQNACAGFIYTTAPPPPVLGAIDAALDLVPAMDAARAHLATQAARVRAAFNALGIDTAHSSTQIIPALVGDAGAALALADALRARNILAVPIRPPTVPAGTSRIRFALSAAHDEAAVDALIAAMAATWPALRQAA